jgi:hypothetical protein
VRVARGTDLRAVRWATARATVRATVRATPLLILANVDNHADQQWPGADGHRRRHRSARARLADWLLRLTGRGARKWVCRLMVGLAGSVADGRDRLTERLPPLSSDAEQQNVREFSRVPLGSRGGLAHRTYVRETRRAREGQRAQAPGRGPGRSTASAREAVVVVAAATGEGPGSTSGLPGSCCTPAGREAV